MLGLRIMKKTLSYFFKPLLFSISFLTLNLVLSSNSFSASNALSLEDIRDSIQKNAPSNVDSFIASLPESLRKRFLIVYQSRSSQSASLENPRIILFGEDGKLLLSFTFSPNDLDEKSFNNRIEIIEQKGLLKPTFAEISFSKGKPSLEKNPARCTACHNGEAIFEGYPHWPGFVGFSDYTGYALEPFEFEQKIIDHLDEKIRNKESRYQHLILPPQMKVIDFQKRNTVVATEIIDRLHRRQNQLVESTAKNLSELNDLFLMSAGVLDEKTETISPIVLNEPRFKPYLKFKESQLDLYTSEAIKYNELKLKQIQKIVDLYGTPLDKIRASHLYAFRKVKPYQPNYKPYPGPNPLPELQTKTYNNLPFFEDSIQFKENGLAFQYFLSTHPEKEAIRLNNGLSYFEINHISGTTLPSLFFHTAGFEDDFTTNGEDNTFLNARNYESISDLYSLVPITLKNVSYTELQAYPDLWTAIQDLQLFYLNIMLKSPIFNKAEAKIFLDLPSLSPEMRKKFEDVIL